MLTRHHWAKNLHDAGYRPRRMKFPQEPNVFKTKASHLDGGHPLWSGMESNGLRHATLPKTRHMKMTGCMLSCRSEAYGGQRLFPVFRVSCSFPGSQWLKTAILVAAGVQRGGRGRREEGWGGGGGRGEVLSVTWLASATTRLG